MPNKKSQQTQKHVESLASKKEVLDRTTVCFTRGQRTQLENEWIKQYPDPKTRVGFGVFIAQMATRSSGNGLPFQITENQAETVLSFSEQKLAHALYQLMSAEIRTALMTNVALGIEKATEGSLSFMNDMLPEILSEVSRLVVHEVKKQNDEAFQSLIQRTVLPSLEQLHLKLDNLMGPMQGGS